jgi:putative serine protease PepD
VACGGSPAAVAPTSSPEPPRASAPTVEEEGDARAPAARVFRRNERSVVTVIGLADGAARAGAADGPSGSGSGFVFDQEGRIVTNDHVVAGADRIAIGLPLDDERIVVPAELVGRDPLVDLAVVQVDVDAKTPDGRRIGDMLRPVVLGDMAGVTIGEPVVAMGAPLGLSRTVSLGIVSALRSPGGALDTGLHLVGGAIQTDAAVNPGSSGGPLFDAEGEVVGVTTSGLSPGGGSVGLNFAIPVDAVARVVPELIAHGCYPHPVVGVRTLPLSSIGQAAKRRLGLPGDQEGLLVQESSAGAAEAGIRAGADVVVAVDGRPVAAAADLLVRVASTRRPDDSVVLTLLRDGERQDVAVKLTRTSAVPCR